MVAATRSCHTGEHRAARVLLGPISQLRSGEPPGHAVVAGERLEKAGRFVDDDEDEKVNKPRKKKQQKKTTGVEAVDDIEGTSRRQGPDERATRRIVRTRLLGLDDDEDERPRRPEATACS